MSTTIESPCILVCVLEPESGHCYGCGRTGDEIASWGMFSPDARRAVMEQLPQRVAKLERPEKRITKRQRQRQRQRQQETVSDAETDTGNGVDAPTA
ncbi:MAG: DUF1289 domain-containing protein [Pseudomonadota bacterium]